MTTRYRETQITHRAAFTLIELLVVIAIIALLAAILFPVFSQAREKGRQVACLSNMRQLGFAFSSYAQDYDELHPFAMPAKGVGGPVGGWWGEGWAYTIQPYAKTYRIFVCPSDEEGAVLYGGWPAPVASMSYAPNASIRGRNTGQFGAIPMGGEWTFAADGSIKSPYRTIGIADIPRPAQTILLAERHNADLKKHGKPGHGVLGYPPFVCTDELDAFFEPGECPNGTLTGGEWPKGIAGTVTVPHSAMTNVCFVDGHVKSVKPEQTNPDPVNQPDRNMWNAARK